VPTRRSELALARLASLDCERTSHRESISNACSPTQVHPWILGSGSIPTTSTHSETFMKERPPYSRKPRPTPPQIPAGRYHNRWSWATGHATDARQPRRWSRTPGVGQPELRPSRVRRNRPPASSPQHRGSVGCARGSGNGAIMRRAVTCAFSPARVNLSVDSLDEP
jgi:hypothetical protein